MNDTDSSPAAAERGKGATEEVVRFDPGGETEDHSKHHDVMTTGEELNMMEGETSSQFLVEEGACVEVRGYATQMLEGTCGSQEEEEEMNYEEKLQLLQQLSEQRDLASQHNILLQLQLARFFIERPGGYPLPDRKVSMDQYRRYLKELADLKQQISTDSEKALEEQEELRLRTQEILETVEKHWCEFIAVKREVAVTLLSGHLVKPVAQEKVDKALVTEQLQQNQLMKLRRKHLRLKFSIERLEAELSDARKGTKEPLQLQFEQLQAERLQHNKQSEQQSEKVVKLQKKMKRNLELVSNIKEKLYWSRMEVLAKREQLAELEAMLAQRRDVLTRARQACSRVKTDNLRLKEERGLLGNAVLLRDFEDTVDASQQLEAKLENLKLRTQGQRTTRTCDVLELQL